MGVQVRGRFVYLGQVGESAKDLKLEMNWIEVKKTDKRALALADRHYSRQKPGSRELGPPGQKIVLLLPDESAVWGSHRPAPWANIKRMDGFEGHSCFLFRNEGATLSSILIREAVAYTASAWGLAPFLTYVAINKVQSINPGFCYKAAGFKYIRTRLKTKHGPMARLEMDLAHVVDCLAEYYPAVHQLKMAI